VINIPLPINPIERELWRKRQSESHKGQHSSVKTEFKKGNKSWMEGKCHTKEVKNILRINHKGMHNSIKTEFKKDGVAWNKGIKTGALSEGTKLKMSNAKKGIIPKNIKILHSKENIKKALRRRIPSSLEDKFQKIIEKYNLPYKYVGDGKIFIERYNPDFINTNNEKIAIEVYARYYKLRNNKTIEKWKEERQNVFNKYGWKIIFFDEVELIEKNVLNKLGKEVI